MSSQIELYAHKCSRFLTEFTFYYPSNVFFLCCHLSKHGYKNVRSHRRPRRIARQDDDMNDVSAFGPTETSDNRHFFYKTRHKTLQERQN